MHGQGQAEQWFWSITYLEYVLCTQSKYPEQWELQLQDLDPKPSYFVSNSVPWGRLFTPVNQSPHLLTWTVPIPLPNREVKIMGCEDYIPETTGSISRQNSS